ncbi:MAG: serine protein kinase [Candidatus Poribacteria bacterium]|nr:serine protein kinase [Candidatus Poribacteria bacterium]
MAEIIAQQTNHTIIGLIQQMQDKRGFKNLHWEGNFEDYLDIIKENPKVIRSAFERIYDMILSYGTQEVTIHKEKLIHYHFFEDPLDGEDPIFGCEKPLMTLVNTFKSAAQQLGTEKRVILLHGPVGSSKSTIVRLLKKGLEEYSKTDEGAVYTFTWKQSDGSDLDCPMHEEPLHLIPKEFRKPVFAALGQESGAEIQIEGDLCPSCRYYYREAIQQSGGDWAKAMEQVRVKRFTFSEQDRVGIGTFQPKDEKNQDSTELTGDINYRKIAEYGSDSDPRAFNFDGEFNIANRGIIEFIEVLKLDVAFLYDLLGASQEHKIKPKKFAQTDIDEVIIGHTNSPEYKKLQNNEFMEALRDRTIKIDIPYVTELSDEIKIYEKDYRPEKVRSKHIAPHTIEIASMWAVLTRLEEPQKANLTLMQKLKLYNGKTIPNYTEDNVRELKASTEREGMEGISPRYIQDKISNALVNEINEGCVSPFMVLNELEGGLDNHSLITSKEQKKRYRDLLAVVKSEFEDIAKNEVQKAIAADEEAISRLCGNYIDNLRAYTIRTKVKNRYTGEDEEPNEQLMRSIEEKIDIPESRKDDFRREMMNYIGALAIEEKKFDYTTNERLRKALELKLFEDQKDSIKLSSLVSQVIDKETQEKIEVVKDRLIKNYGYCDLCATDVLSYVASIFARGDAKEST